MHLRRNPRKPDVRQSGTGHSGARVVTISELSFRWTVFNPNRRERWCLQISHGSQTVIALGAGGLLQFFFKLILERGGRGDRKKPRLLFHLLMHLLAAA